MNYKIDFLDTDIFVSFNDLKEDEIIDAFIEITDTIDIKKIKNIIFDCTNATNYTSPKNYLKKAKIVTLFSVEWNSKITIVFVATNPIVRKMVSDFINHKDILKWKYMLFDDLDQALSWLKENK